MIRQNLTCKSVCMQTDLSNILQPLTIVPSEAHKSVPLTIQACNCIHKNIFNLQHSTQKRLLIKFAHCSDFNESWNGWRLSFDKIVLFRCYAMYMPKCLMNGTSVCRTKLSSLILLMAAVNNRKLDIFICNFVVEQINAIYAVFNFLAFFLILGSLCSKKPLLNFIIVFNTFLSMNYALSFSFLWKRRDLCIN